MALTSLLMACVRSAAAVATASVSLVMSGTFLDRQSRYRAGVADGDWHRLDRVLFGEGFRAGAGPRSGLESFGLFRQRMIAWAPRRRTRPAGAGDGDGNASGEQIPGDRPGEGRHPLRTRSPEMERIDCTRLPVQLFRGQFCDRTDRCLAAVAVGEPGHRGR